MVRSRKSVRQAPERGDVVRFSTRSSAVAVSPVEYNRKVGLAIFCPITSQRKGYPFEVLVPEGLPIGGVILADQIKSLDWNQRRAKFICRLPRSTVDELLDKITTLISTD